MISFLSIYTDLKIKKKTVAFYLFELINHTLEEIANNSDSIIIKNE